MIRVREPWFGIVSVSAGPTHRKQVPRPWLGEALQLESAVEPDEDSRRILGDLQDGAGLPPRASLLDRAQPAPDHVASDCG